MNINDIPSELFVSPVSKWIILHNAPGPEPAWWGEEETPFIFDTEKEATISMVEDFIYTLQTQIEEVKLGARDLDEIDKECDEWVEECTVDDNGCIYQLDGTQIYNPKTFVR